jgi:predicted site-specific integrase-resolvase
MLKVSPATLDRYVREGKLRRRSPAGTRGRFHVDDINAFGTTDERTTS